MTSTFAARLSILLITGTLVFVLPGCMHAIMMGGHGDDMKADAVISKRIVENNIIVSAVIPSMKAEDENIIEISIKHADDLKPIRGTEVTYHWMPKVNSAHQHSKSGPSDTTMLHGTAKETNDGTYSFTLSNLSEGSYSLTITVLAVSSSKPISFEVERTIPMKHSMGIGMMGMGASPTTWIIGGALMAAMMLVMWSVRGGLLF